MICSALIPVLRSCANEYHSGYYHPEIMLRCGAAFSEPRCPFTSELRDWEADRMHEGKEASIANMLAGGNGYPDCKLQTHMARACFDVGVKRERDDLKALKFWQMRLSNCRADMYRRFDV